MVETQESGNDVEAVVVLQLVSLLYANQVCYIVTKLDSIWVNCIMTKNRCFFSLQLVIVFFMGYFAIKPYTHL